MQTRKIFKRWMKQAMSVSLAMSVMVSMACTAWADVKNANQDPANTEVTDETLHVTMPSEPSVLWSSGGGKLENEANTISGVLLDSLIRVDRATGDLLPNLASDWYWSDDTHLTFVLREDVVMTDGTLLEAEDVAYCVNEIWIGLNAANDTGRYLAGAEVEDEHTVTIEYNTVAPDILYMMAWTNFGIVTEAEVEALGGPEAAAKNPVLGCGKYKFVEWKNGESVKVTRNEEYWNPEWKGYYKDIVFTFVNDPAARVVAVKSGDSDVACDIPTVQASAYAADNDLQVMICDSGQVNDLWYNMTEGHATADQKVREAISCALDYQAIAQIMTGGLGTEALGYCCDGGKYYHQMYEPGERHEDQERARALLEEAGYGDGLELECITTQDYEPAYSVIQENLRLIGIKLTINPLDTASFVENVFAGNYDIIVVGEMTDVRYPTLFQFLDKETIEGGFVFGGPKTTTDEIDAMISEIIEEKDESAAKDKMLEMEQVMQDDSLCSYLYTLLGATVISKDLKGFTSFERSFVDPTSLYK